MSITVNVVSIPEGKASTITLTKTGQNTGNIVFDGQSFNLTNIAVRNEGLFLSCSGPLDSTVSCSIHPPAPSTSPFISVDIRSFIFHSTKNYQLKTADEQKLAQFMKASFPQMA